MVGVGAYASGPVVAEAALRGIPTVAVEMDSHMGWTNTILSKLVDRVCLSYPDERRRSGKFVYTGRPLRPALLSATREQGLERFGLDAERPVLLVFGGSLGAHTLNEAVLEAFAREQTPFQIVHVTGRERLRLGDGDACSSRAPTPPIRRIAFLDDFPLALAAADAVVARAGGSVAEILARGVPSLLVPYPFAAGDHQAKNAAQGGGGGRRAGDGRTRNWTPKAGRGGRPNCSTPEVNERMRAGGLGLAVPDAAVRIADVVVELVDPARRVNITWTTTNLIDTTSISAPESLRSLHFIGIGGAGMSGIALVLRKRGYEVTGSDLKPSRYVTLLESAGVPVTIGHSARNLDHPDVVVISSAVPAHNVELQEARRRGILVVKRAQALAWLMDVGARRGGLRHARQDHHHLHDQPRARWTPAWTRPSWWGASSTTLVPTLATARGSSWSARPTSPTARCCC